MNDSGRKYLIKISSILHSAIESSYLGNVSTKGDGEWLEKQRALLAKMAVHLLQTAIKPGEIELDNIKNSLHTILNNFRSVFT